LDELFALSSEAVVQPNNNSTGDPFGLLDAEPTDPNAVSNANVMPDTAPADPFSSLL
jgi:hypothetical protein